MGFDVSFQDNSDEIALHAGMAMIRALNEIGETATKYAVLKTPTDTGRLKNSITYDVRDEEVYIGTNVPYGVFVEYGTGKHATNGKGRPGYWVYVNDPTGNKRPSASVERKIYTEAEAKRIMAILQAKGLDAHMTEGIEPCHMLRDAASKHTEQYKRIIERALQDA